MTHKIFSDSFSRNYETQKRKILNNPLKKRKRKIYSTWERFMGQQKAPFTVVSNRCLTVKAIVVAFCKLAIDKAKSTMVLLF